MRAEVNRKRSNWHPSSASHWPDMPQRHWCVCEAPATRETACCDACRESDHIKLPWRLADWQWGLAGQWETSGLHHDLCDMTRLWARPEDRAPSKVQVTGHKQSWKAKHDRIYIILAILQHKDDMTHRSRHRPTMCIIVKLVSGGSRIKKTVCLFFFPIGWSLSCMHSNHLRISIRKSVLHINPSFN